jgi:fructosamine-3-kinase
MDELLERTESILAETEEDGPAFLHGDLWTGNYYCGPDGHPVLIDPAVYVGAGEVDLAMMEFFGNLPPGFMEGYGSIRNPAPEYAAFRRDIYQLYYLLVHVNLFGGGYESGSLAAARRVLARA